MRDATRMQEETRMNGQVTQAGCPKNPIDAVADELLESYRTLSRQAFRFLRQLREFDLGQGYRRPRKAARAAANTAAWLNRACGIDQEAAREQLRIAYALLNLPLLEDAFEQGDLSYRKVSALTLVADAANEAALLDFALVMTETQVEDYCQRLGKSATRR